MDDKQREELDNATDFKRTQFKQYPTIKFTATNTAEYSKAGSFTLLENDEDGKLKVTDLGKELSCVFIQKGKFRLKGSDYNTRDVIFNKTKPITLYGRTKDGKQMVVGEGAWHALKKDYGLSAHQYPYIKLRDGTIARLDILPSSLSNYWKYCADFKNDERIYCFYTNVKASAKMEQGKKGKYYLMDFIRQDEIEPDEFSVIETTIKDLRNELKNVEDAYKEKQDDYAQLELSEGVLPVIDEVETMDEPPQQTDEELKELSKESL